jgi:hypothetical protein
VSHNVRTFCSSSHGHTETTYNFFFINNKRRKKKEIKRETKASREKEKLPHTKAADQYNYLVLKYKQIQHCAMKLETVHAYPSPVTWDTEPIFWPHLLFPI